MSESRSNLNIGVFAVCVASVAALLAPVMRGEFPAGHDATAHLTYTYLFDRAISEGQFPVRWIEWVRVGHGQPLFSFYQPGFYYFVQLIHQAVPSLQASLRLSVLFLWWIAAGFTFLLLKRFGTLPAGAGAVSLAFSPYLILDVFVRSAYPELAGIAFGIGSLWALDKWLRDARPWTLPVLAVLLALLAVSHPPTTLIFSPVLAAYAIVLLVARETTLKRLVWLTPAVLLGIGIAAFYLLPAIAELHLIRSGELTREAFDFRRHFLFPSQWVNSAWGFGASLEGPKDGMSFQLSAVQWTVFALALVVVITDLVRRRIGSRTRYFFIWWVLAAACALLLTTSASLKVWESLPMLPFVQYPWRFLMVVSVAGAVVAARLLSLVGDRVVQAVLVLCLIGVQVQLAHTHLVPNGYIGRERIDIDWFDWQNTRRGRDAAFLENAYFPRTLSAGPVESVSRWTVARGLERFKEIDVKGHELTLDLTTNEPTVLRVNSPAFPGWQAWVDGAPVPVSAWKGYLSIDIPQGTHTVCTRFTNTPVRTAGNAISLVSLATVFLWSATFAVRGAAAARARRSDDLSDRSVA